MFHGPQAGEELALFKPLPRTQCGWKEVSKKGCGERRR